jgi:hypothetical protein
MDYRDQSADLVRDERSKPRFLLRGVRVKTRGFLPTTGDLIRFFDDRVVSVDKCVFLHLGDHTGDRYSCDQFGSW